MDEVPGYDLLLEEKYQNKVMIAKPTDHLSVLDKVDKLLSKT